MKKLTALLAVLALSVAANASEFEKNGFFND